MASLISEASELTAQKQELLLQFYKTSSDEVFWRRTAGYRTVILGLGYCGIILTVVACHPIVATQLKASLAAVMTLAALFGSGYLVSNYSKYIGALSRMILIEEQVGAFDPDFLGAHGPLMRADRKAMQAVPLLRNPICIGSILAFGAGGLLTALAVLTA